MSDEQQQTITVDDEHYAVADFSEQQQYLLKQVQDLTQKSSSLQFQLDQTSVAKQWFTDNLIASLKSEESDDGVAGADIAAQ